MAFRRFVTARCVAEAGGAEAAKPFVAQPRSDERVAKLISSRSPLSGWRFEAASPQARTHPRRTPSWRAWGASPPCGEADGSALFD